MMRRRYRATGADGPFGDPRRAHGVAMEGYYWRFTEPRSGRVVVALCGVNAAPDGRWATVALVGHPGRFLRDAALQRAGADEHRLGAWANGSGEFAADARRVRLDLGPGARIEARIDDAHGWPRRPFGGLGVAHVVPGLGQYWHPHVLGGRATGAAVLGDEVVDLDGATVYAEKNWGRGGFPDRWWWGQAHGFADADVCVAFAGGSVTLGPVSTTATAIVVRLGDEVVRLGDPLLSPVRAEVGDRGWRLRGRGPRWSVEVEADADPAEAHALPVPVPAERRNVHAAHQHLAGRLRLVVRHGRRVAFTGESGLAGLERGTLDPTGGPP
ncbi:MAG TPA: tocopherol cyclase family protein [Capillimicrobium sp.]|nr:tocopherol cyclase family protein [Capillimicrobium sp.]